MNRVTLYNGGFIQRHLHYNHYLGLDPQGGGGGASDGVLNNFLLNGTILTATTTGGLFSVDLATLPKDDDQLFQFDPTNGQWTVTQGSNNDQSGDLSQGVTMNTGTNILTIFGVPIDLSIYLDDTDEQTLTLVGSQLSISNGNTVTLPTGGTGGDNGMFGSQNQGGTWAVTNFKLGGTTLMDGDNQFLIFNNINNFTTTINTNMTTSIGNNGLILAGNLFTVGVSDTTGGLKLVTADSNISPNPFRGGEVIVNRGTLDANQGMINGGNAIVEYYDIFKGGVSGLGTVASLYPYGMPNTAPAAGETIVGDGNGNFVLGAASGGGAEISHIASDTGDEFKNAFFNQTGATENGKIRNVLITFGNQTAGTTNISIPSDAKLDSNGFPLYWNIKGNYVFNNDTESLAINTDSNFTFKVGIVAGNKIFRYYRQFNSSSTSLILEYMAQ